MRPNGAFLGAPINEDGALRPDANSEVSVYRYNMHNHFNSTQESQWVAPGQIIGIPAWVTGVPTEYLVVGGGGGGGFGVGGGGGAGGFRTGITAFDFGQTVVVTVGDGGAAGVSGNNSVLGSITSAGGGAGSGGTGLAGGSGGGGGNRNSTPGGAGNTPAVDPSQGNAGGSSLPGNTTGTSAGGGGGGAGSAGTSVTSAIKGHGGAGANSSITGTEITYAGGGGGGIRTLNKEGGLVTGGNAGSGGGGAGGNGSQGLDGKSSGTAGGVNTGGGGGGGGADQNGGVAGSAGGSGVVIVKYPSGFDLTATANLTYSTNTISGYKITQFTAGNGIISINTVFSLGRSVYFDSSGDNYIDLPSSATLDVGTSSDFTAECWFRNDDLTEGLMFDTRNNSSAGWILLQVGADGKIGCYVGTSSTPFVKSPAHTTNVWTHAAITRNSGTVRFFVDGVEIGSRSSDTTNISFSQIRIGGRYTVGSRHFQGYISNVRFVTGTAVYTSAFNGSLPTAPLTAIPGTVLLACRNTTIIDDSLNNTLSTSGDIFVSEENPFS